MDLQQGLDPRIKQGINKMRRMPLFPLVPLLPLGILAGALTFSVMSYRRVRRLEARLGGQAPNA